MRRAISLFSIVCLSVALTGCVAAGAGAVAGDAAVSPSDEAIEYVRTHDLEPYIGRAIERGDIVRGMSKEDVRFVKGEPRRVEEEDGQKIWFYGTVTQKTRFYFEEGKLVEVI